MNGRRNPVYRLSSDFQEQPSPIIRAPYHLYPLNGVAPAVSDGLRTSTPISQGPWRKDILPNGSLGLFTPTGHNGKKVSPLKNENRPVNSVSRSDDQMYTPKSSPWLSNTSTKSVDKSSGIATAQTRSSPLIGSSRYNIDPKIYTDVNSPGLTTRLSKYVNEANSKLTQRPHYAVGQFPKVNLNATPIPVLSTKVIRSRAPVTIKIAPPELTSFCTPSDSQVTSDQRKSFSSSLHCELKQDTKTRPSVAQVLKEISLKRHASREDIMSDLVKKQKTDRVVDDRLENLEEIIQKRARDDSVPSEEEVSPQSKVQRPSKRPKASSCHDILNSLSSSTNFVSGVKRKTMDTSRCNTPDVEKHFKPATSLSPSNTTQSGILRPKAVTTKEILNVKVPITNEVISNKTQPTVDQRDKDKVEAKSLSTTKTEEKSSPTLTTTSTKVNKEVQAEANYTNLTDKLFMKAEPKTNEKFKSIIEEQANIEVKFNSDDKDEIKKQDIVHMRENSMRQRLKSMFDAISGKTATKIDPGVVIQAENTSPPSSSEPSLSTYTSLTSSTSTTSINTSPITSSSIVPILKSDSKSPSTKHVTFNLATTSTTIVSASTISVPTESNSLNNNITVTTSAPQFNFGTSNNQLTTQLDSQLIQTSASSFPAATTAINNITFTTQASSLNINTCKMNTASQNPQLTFTSVKTTSTTSSNDDTLKSSSPTLTFGSSSTSSNNPPQEGLLFGTVKQTQANSTFGSTIASTTQSLPSVTNSSSFTIPASTTSVAANVPTTATTLSFGSTSTNNFSFGSATNKANMPIATCTSFSLPATTSANNTNLFGSSTIQTSAVPTTSKSVSNFETTTQSSFTAFPSTATKSLSTFGTFGHSTTAASTTLGNSSIFGNANQMTTAPSATIFSTNVATTAAPNFFGSTPTPATANITFGSSPAPTSANMFNSSSSTFSSQPKPSNIFSGTSSTTAPTVTSQSIFGANAASPTIFSGTNTNAATVTTTSTTTVPTFGESTNVFGQQNSFSFGSNSTTFGSSNITVNSGFQTATTAASIFNVANTNNFSSPATAASIFTAPGTSNTASNLPSFGTIKPLVQFGQTSKQQTSSSIFASTNTTTFSNPNATQSPFGVSSTNSSLTFGNSNKFGSQNQNPTSAFGGTSPIANSTFGGSKSGNAFEIPTPQSKPQTNNSSSSGLFQFGAGSNQTQSSTGGFNFNAPTGAPSINFTGSLNSAPAYNANFQTATQGNMFSIGSGSSASSTPRARAVRSRRQR